MNRPSRNDDTEDHPDWNQSPHSLSADLTTRADLNGIVNLREQRENDSSLDNSEQEQINIRPLDTPEPPSSSNKTPSSVKVDSRTHDHQHSSDPGISAVQQPTTTFSRFRKLRNPKSVWTKLVAVLQKYVKFIGPGFMIAVAYIDPGNYATDVEAGASTRYRHLFIILLSNLFAIFLQSLCIKLGSVTGLDLAENCRKHLPRWLNLILYLLAESAIIATDIAEVSLTPINHA